MSVETESEKAFQLYLEGRGLKWSQGPSYGRRRPDFKVQHEGKTCLFEVKEFDDPAIKPNHGYSPCLPIQEKINRARKQFKEYRDHCCVLVLWNSKSIFRSVQTEVVLSAAFGKNLRADPMAQQDLGAEPRSFQFFGPAALTPTANTTISAIVILVPYQLDQVWLEAWRRLSEKKQRGEPIQASDQFNLTQQVADEFVGTRYLYQGTIRTIVLENPYARISFPPELFKGRFDQRWHLKDGHFALSFMGAELTRLKQSGVPFVYL